MPLLTNKVSRLIYDRGLVCFSLENEGPAPHGSVQIEPVVSLTIRYEDFEKIVQFLNDQSTNIRPIDLAWKESLALRPSTKVVQENSQHRRPEIGSRIGPQIE